MLLGIVDSTVATEAFIQYGCFGLLAGLVVWSLKYGIPKALAMHKEALASVVSTFERESNQCRQERLDTSRQAAEERDKDREARHDLVNKFQELIAVLQKDNANIRDGRARG